MTNLSPEINIARRLVEKYDLTPPIDITSLVKKYALLEETLFPLDIDGISLHLKTPGKRPKIIINSNSSMVRSRFTLAHELGHVLIPWHTGNIVDLTEEKSIPGEEYWEIEAEANRFASELLMPRQWVKKEILKHNAPDIALQNIARIAGVSSHAAIIRLIACSDPGNIFASISVDGEILFSGRSKGTLANLPDWGTHVDPNSLFPFCKEKYDFAISNNHFYWWKFTEKVSIPSERHDLRSWKEILNHIIIDIGIPPDEQNAMKKTIHGLIGYANSQIRGDKRTLDLIYSACLQRVHSELKFAAFRNHPDFGIFLIKRIQNLLDRH